MYSFVVCGTNYLKRDVGDFIFNGGKDYPFTI